MSENKTCPCGAPLVRDGVTVKSHWTGSVCEDCEAAMFEKHAHRAPVPAAPAPDDEPSCSCGDLDKRPGTHHARNCARCYVPPAAPEATRGVLDLSPIGTMPPDARMGNATPPEATREAAPIRTDDLRRFAEAIRVAADLIDAERAARENETLRSRLDADEAIFRWRLGARAPEGT